MMMDKVHVITVMMDEVHVITVIYKYRTEGNIEDLTEPAVKPRHETRYLDTSSRRVCDSMLLASPLLSFAAAVSEQPWVLSCCKGNA